MLARRFLPKDLQIIGYARSKLTNESLREKLQGHLKGEGATDFLSRVTYIPGSYDGDEGFQVTALQCSMCMSLPDGLHMHATPCLVGSCSISWLGRA